MSTAEENHIRYLSDRKLENRITVLESEAQINASFRRKVQTEVEENARFRQRVQGAFLFVVGVVSLAAGAVSIAKFLQGFL